MKKAFFMNIIAIMLVVFCSFTSVYAETLKLPLNLMSAKIEDHGHYKSLNSKNSTISYTYDDDSIDFKYVIKNGDSEKVYTTSFELKDDVYSYTYTGDKTDTTQIKLDKVAFESVLYAVGELNALQRDFLEDISEDYSRYTFDKYGIEVKTFTYGSGKEAIESFKLHTTEISAYGTSFMPIPETKQEVVTTEPEPETEPVSKDDTFKSLVLGLILVVVVILIIALAIKTKKANVVKKAKKSAKKTK